MPYRNLSLEELARHIGIDARTVRKWAEKGQMPGQIVGGEWRFNRAQMVEWLQQHMHSFNEQHIREVELAMRSPGQPPLLESYLATEACDLALPARSRPSVLRELVLLAERTGQVYDAPTIISALEAREGLGSTALPRGIAFPHPRRPLMFATAEPLVCLARVPAGVPFGAPDGGLTDIFVLVLANDGRLHLGLLARLAQMFNTDLPDRLREMTDSAEAVELMLAMEREFLARDKR